MRNRGAIAAAEEMLRRKGYADFDIEQNGSKVSVLIDSMPQVQVMDLNKLAGFVSALPEIPVVVEEVIDAPTQEKSAAVPPVQTQAQEATMSENLSELTADIEEDVTVTLDGDLAALTDDIPETDRPMAFREVVAVLQAAFNDRLEVEVVYVDAGGARSTRIIQPFSPPLRYTTVFSITDYPKAVEFVKKATRLPDGSYKYGKQRLCEWMARESFRTLKTWRIVSAKVVGKARGIPYYTDGRQDGDLYVPTTDKLVQPWHYEEKDGKRVVVLGGNMLPTLRGVDPRISGLVKLEL